MKQDAYDTLTENNIIIIYACNLYPYYVYYISIIIKINILFYT